MVVGWDKRVTQLIADFELVGSTLQYLVCSFNPIVTFRSLFPKSNQELYSPSAKWTCGLSVETRRCET